jgi:hypothetical protein
VDEHDRGDNGSLPGQRRGRELCAINGLVASRG